MQSPLPDNETDRLAALYALDILDSAPEQDFDDIVALASSVCGTPMSLVTLVDTDRLWFKARVGTDLAEIPREMSFCAHAILARDMLVVPDATKDARFADNPSVDMDGGIRFYAGAPLVTPGGYVLGTLCVVDHRVPAELHDDDVAVELLEPRQRAGEDGDLAGVAVRVVPAHDPAGADLLGQPPLRCGLVEPDVGGCGVLVFGHVEYAEFSCT